jgi:pimeloyl-ACP methyl ester carboxylesterase
LTTSDGFELAVQVSGSGARRPLVLLPGQANSHVWWDDLRPDLDPHFQVISFDYRGTGGSRGSVGDWTTSLFAQDAVEVIEAFAEAPVAVYATSMGGRVAQMLALEHAHAVDRMALACTSPGGALAEERGPEVRRALAHPDPAQRRSALLTLFYTPGRLALSTRSNLLGDATMSAMEARAHLRASDSHDAGESLTAIVAPVLVLHGTDDAMVPVTNAHVLASRIPDATVSTYDGGRHGFFEEFSDVVTPEVLHFLT